jgi:hypothetical protein
MVTMETRTGCFLFWIPLMDLTAGRKGDESIWERRIEGRGVR